MEPVDVGERWGYRARGIDPLVEVEVVKLGTNKPARVLVHFVAEEFEGREEWVPPARLKVTWDRAAGFDKRERLWNAVVSVAYVRGTPEAHAADEVFELLIPEECASLGYNRETGVARIYDVNQLAELLGLDKAVLLEHPTAFESGGDWIVPWPTTKLIATTAARLHSDTVMEVVVTEERKAQREAMRGYYYRSRGQREPSHMPAEICRETDGEYGKPKRTVLREWCGAEAVDRYDELAALRTEVDRLGEIVLSAARTMDANGLRTQAKALRTNLGTTIDDVRSSSR